MTSNLPEPNFIDRNPEEVTNAWIQRYEDLTGKTLYPAQIDRFAIDMGAYRENILRVEIQETSKKNLLSYAPLDVLKHIGEPQGVTQLLADYSKTTIKFSVDEALDFDFAIQANTEIESKDGLFIFATTSEVTLKKGELTVSAEAVCETAGSASNNYSIGSINNILTPLDYISKAENITVTSGGADDESAEQLRERIRLAPEKYSNAGSKGAYRYHTLSVHQSITDVTITSPSPGIIYVYPLTSNGNPSEELIKKVQDYLNDDKVRPLTDYVLVKSPEQKTFSIESDILLYSYADIDSVKKTIDAKLTEYKLQLSEKLGKNVVATQIIAILNSIYGVYKVTLKTPDDIEIEEHQWANLLNYDIKIGGYADE